MENKKSFSQKNFNSQLKTKKTKNQGISENYNDSRTSNAESNQERTEAE